MSPQSPLVSLVKFSPAVSCAVLVERLEQAIQLTASTPEMSTGSLGFSVQLLCSFVRFNALFRFCRIVRGIIIHLRNTKPLRKRKLLLKKLQSESFIFFLSFQTYRFTLKIHAFLFGKQISVAVCSVLCTLKNLTSLRPVAAIYQEHGEQESIVSYKRE